MTGDGTPQMLEVMSKDIGPKRLGWTAHGGALPDRRASTWPDRDDGATRRQP